MAIGALSAYFEGWHPLFIVLFALGLPMVIVLGAWQRAAWEEWSLRSSQNVREKQDRAERMAEGHRALDGLRKLDPEAAERIAEAIDSGMASSADLTVLVARARQDALSAGKSEGPPTVKEFEARLRAEGRLPPSEPPPTDEAEAVEP